MNATPSSMFRSAEEFNSYWLSQSKFKISLPDTHHVKIVPTHGDLNDRNIIIKDRQIVAILDWETFGWYPDYWELIPTWNIRLGHGLKWGEALKKVFGPQSEYYVAYKTILDAAFQEPENFDIAAALQKIGIC